MIGMILGNRYEILKEIGSGGMANVYLAHCRLLNRNVAVKILKNEFANDKEFLERFNKEAQAAAAISSPNIVNVYDVGHDGDIHYIVMEYVEGHTLKEYIDANGMLSWQETVEYAIQICSALDRAHKNGIIHRDIKPQNIILTKDGVLKVTDFGIARASSNETKNMGESTMGSVHYFSPEQARGGYTDAKSDIYSLGIVMYELITGILPFNGESPIAIAIKHMQEKPVSPKEFNVSIPLAVERIILKAMSKEQSLRYQSAEEMLADLNVVIHKPSEHMVVGSLDYGDTIKMEPINPISPVTPVNPVSPVNQDPTPRRPVHADGRKPADKTENPKPEKPKEKGTKRAVFLAVIAAFLVIGLAFGAVILIILNGNSCTGGENGSTVNQEKEVPYLVGMDYTKAVAKYGEDFVISKTDEKRNDVEEGTILSQTPEAGKMVKGDIRINVVVAAPLNSFILSDYKGYTESEFVKDFKQYDEEYDVNYRIETEASLDVEKGKVVRTEPPFGTTIDKGSEVVVYVSAGGFKMEDLTGLTLRDATEWIEDNGLTVGRIDPRNGKDYYVVESQSVDPGDPVAEGDSIDLVLKKVDAPEPSNPVVNTKTITIMIPQDRDSTLITVYKDTERIYNSTHSKSEIYVEVPVTGSGSINVEIYFDGDLTSSMTVNL